MNDTDRTRYSGTGKKIGDLFLGAGIGIAMTIAMLYVAGALERSITLNEAAGLIFVIILSVLLIVFFFRIKRGFIAIGMLAALLIPFLVAGGCLSTITF